MCLEHIPFSCAVLWHCLALYRIRVDCTSKPSMMACRRLLAWGVLASMVSGDFYPHGHFDRVEKVTDYGLFLDYIEEQIEQGKTVFVRWIPTEGCKQAPSWNDVTRMFEGNPDVAFADINLKESPMMTGEELGNPGSGGWPTIRYFNKSTGQYGEAYRKVTDLPMWQELLDRMRMIDYVEDYGNTVLCGLDGKNCNDKETGYLEKWKVKTLDEVETQFARLEVMTSKPMSDDLLEWAWRRMRILKKIKAAGVAAESEL